MNLAKLRGRIDRLEREQAEEAKRSPNESVESIGLMLAKLQHDREERQRLGLPEWSWRHAYELESRAGREAYIPLTESLNPRPLLPPQYDDEWFKEMAFHPDQRAALSAEGRAAYEQWEAWANRSNAGKRIVEYRHRLGLPPLTDDEWEALSHGSTLIDESIRLGTLVRQAESVAELGDGLLTDTPPAELP